MATKSLWDESKHPRDESGEFALKGTKTPTAAPAAPAAPPPRQTMMFDTNKTLRLFEGALFEAAKKQKKAAKAPAPPASLLEKIEDDLSKQSAASKPLGGQKGLFARRFHEAVERYAARKAAAGQRSLSWDETAHPRDDDGQFTFKHETAKPTAEEKKADTGPAGLTKHEALKKAAEGSKAKLLSYDQACRATYLYTDTTAQDWKAVPIKGVVEVDTGGGKMRSMPEFEFPSGYSQVETPHGSDGCCQLCGHNIKRVYHLQNDKAKTTMAVGSECVTHFTEGKSGERLTKEAKDQANRDFVGEAQATIEKIKQWHARVNQNYGGSSFRSAVFKIKIPEVRIAASALARSLGANAELWLRTGNWMYLTDEAVEKEQKFNRYAEKATPQKVANWVKKYGEKARGWIETIDNFLHAGSDAKEKFARRFEQRLERYAQPRFATSLRKTHRPKATVSRPPDESRGHWVTIRGAHVFIEGNQIVKGPPGLTGKGLDATKPAEGAKPLEPAAGAQPLKPTSGHAPQAPAPAMPTPPADPDANRASNRIDIPDDIHFEEWNPAEDDVDDAPKPKISQLPGAIEPLQTLRSTPDGRLVGNTILKASQIHADPKRFQYKISGIDPKTGTTAELKGVKQFNPMLGGQLAVWLDPNDGKTYVVNGHHRLELAQRSPSHEGWDGSMSVYFVDAKTPEHARALGALINIAEGRGTAVDAAKFIRDFGATDEEFEQHGISSRGRIAKEGRVLSQLSGHGFQQLANGMMTEGRALAVAEPLAGMPDRQDALFRMLEKLDAKKPVPDGQVREMAAQAAAMVSSKKPAGGGGGLWDDDFDEIPMKERADIAAYIRNQIGSDVRTFQAGSSKRKAGKLESAGDNKLDVEGNKQLLKEAAIMAEDFDSQKNKRGPLAEYLDQVAVRLKNEPRKANAIRTEALQHVAGLLRERQAAHAGTNAGGVGGVSQHDVAGAGATGPDKYARRRSLIVQKFSRALEKSFRMTLTRF